MTLLSRAGAILTPAEMSGLDAQAAAAGVPVLTLMENAGRAVADEIVRRYGARPTLVLCGPGNNGGDGYVAARHLRRWGWPVRVAAIGQSRGPAAAMAARWEGDTLTLTGGPDDGRYFREAGLLVDALLGAGFRPGPDTPILAAARQARQHPTVVAVDLPSGIDGATGHGDTGAPVALTVTFVAKKPAHVLQPARTACGEIVVLDIGMPDVVCRGIQTACHENRPALWQLPRRGALSHKYRHGHALVLSGGPTRTGAARLAAAAALKAGAGLVTLAAAPSALAVLAAHCTAVMLAEAAGPASFERLVAEPRISAICIGPAAGIGAKTRAMVHVALAAGRPVLLDADALTSFAGDPAALFAALGGTCVLTPHEGEFARLFPDVDPALSKVERARAAARLAGAVLLLKGADTVIAAPDGGAIVNTHAPAGLATAGSGDVLAGIITGLLAQGMPAFAAAAAGAWLHGEAARLHPHPGLTAEDLPPLLPAAQAAALAWRD